MAQLYHSCVPDPPIGVHIQFFQIRTSVCNRLEIFGPHAACRGIEFAEIRELIVVERKKAPSTEIEVVADVDGGQSCALQELFHIFMLRSFESISFLLSLWFSVIRWVGRGQAFTPPRIKRFLLPEQTPTISRSTTFGICITVSAIAIKVT